MDLDALARIFRPERARAPVPTDAPEMPQPAPESERSDPPPWAEARAERAAILEHEAGLSRAAAEAEAARLYPEPEPDAPRWRWLVTLPGRPPFSASFSPAATRREVETLHPSATEIRPEPEPDLEPAAGAPELQGFELPEIQTAAGSDWPEIANRPDALSAFAFLLRTRAQRERGEVPEHYTRPALCASCGPVWLWDGSPSRVLACPWCIAAPPQGVEVPRPPVRCGRCARFEPHPSEPESPGRCEIEAPASAAAELFPDIPRICGAWRPRGAHE